MEKIKVKTEQWEDIYGGSLDSLMELIEKHKSSGATSYRAYGDRDGDASLVFTYEREETDAELEERKRRNTLSEIEAKKLKEWQESDEGKRLEDQWMKGIAQLGRGMSQIIPVIENLSQDTPPEQDGTIKINYNPRN